jgi:polysaccharide pyruvyl transferase WcaK-like protein
VEVQETELPILGVRKDATIGVFGHFGNRNLGDEAIITAVVQNIRQRLPTAKVVGFSLNPADTSARFDILAYPIRRLRPSAQPEQFECAQHGHQQDGTSYARFVSTARTLVNQSRTLLKRASLVRQLVIAGRALLRFPLTVAAEVGFACRCYRLLKGIHLLMVTGSNQFLDNFGGPWGFPYTLLKWSTLARLAGAKVVYVSVGAGPLTSKLSFGMVRLALKMSAYTSLRDVRSQELLRTIGVLQSTYVFPDLAYSLKRTHKPLGQRVAITGRRKPRIGINVMPVYDSRYWHIHDAERYSTYVENLAAFSAALLRDDYPVVFWGTQPSDANVTVDLLSRLQNKMGTTLKDDGVADTFTSVAQLLEFIEGLDLVVATRFHGVVLSLFASKPVIAICYHRKIDDLMKEMGQADYSIMFDALEANDLLRRFRQLEHNVKKESERIRHKTDEYRRSLATQYDLLFGSSISL